MPSTTIAPKLSNTTRWSTSVVWCGARIASSAKSIAGATGKSEEQRTSQVFTPRERFVLRGVFEGLTNKEIATHLNLSEQTVKNHVHRILRKVGAEDRLSVLEVCQSQFLRL